jgi:predicted GTPase
MKYWRLIVLALLLLVPVAFLGVVASVALYQWGWWVWAWWPMTACLVVALFLANRWQSKRQLLALDETPPVHWTERDQKAWQLVLARAKKTDQVEMDRLGTPQFYLDTAQDMAKELAEFYHPGTKDPVASLTIPEILAVVELASGDLAEMVEKYLPAGHLITVRDWRRARQAADWYNTASNVYWAVSGIFNPVNTATKYIASKIGLSTPLQLLQKNLILWFYSAFIHRLGTYLIDLNSGRLRVGARRYRALKEEHRLALEAIEKARAGDLANAAADGEAPAATVTITLFGQVKAGKSSLINALLGEQAAVTDVVPATQEITRYTLQQQGLGSSLVLLDTIGYAQAEITKKQYWATFEAARDADLLVFVTHALNPGRQADVEVLKALKDWYVSNPDLKMPPILGVVTHIDLLSPAMEWSPPYNWKNPVRPKEKSVAECVNYCAEQMGEFLEGIVPVCAAVGKVYGVQEGVLPALTKLLDKAHASAMLRCLHAEANDGKIRKVFDQLLATGREAFNLLWTSGKKS